MGWNRFKILNRWGCLSPFRITPPWKEGVDEINGKWIESTPGAYHWEAERELYITGYTPLGNMPIYGTRETGNFIKVPGDLFVEFDPDESGYDLNSKSGDIFLGQFNEGNDSPYDVGDDYPNVYHLIVEYWEYDAYDVLFTNPFTGEPDTVRFYKAACKNARKFVSIYKYVFDDWVLVRKEDNTYFPK